MIIVMLEGKRYLVPPEHFDAFFDRYGKEARVEGYVPIWKPPVKPEDGRKKVTE